MKSLPLWQQYRILTTGRPKVDPPYVPKPPRYSIGLVGADAVLVESYAEVVRIKDALSYKYRDTDFIIRELAMAASA